MVKWNRRSSVSVLMVNGKRRLSYCGKVTTNQPPFSEMGQTESLENVVLLDAHVVYRSALC